jgi:hypothetical protein
MPDERLMRRPGEGQADALQREIEERRRDLAWAISELSALIRDTLSPRRQARRALLRTQEAIREHPGPFVAAAAVITGVLGVLGFLWGRRALQRHRYAQAARRHPVAATVIPAARQLTAKVRQAMRKGANGA